MRGDQCTDLVEVVGHAIIVIIVVIVVCVLVCIAVCVRCVIKDQQRVKEEARARANEQQTQIITITGQDLAPQM